MSGAHVQHDSTATGADGQGQGLLPEPPQLDPHRTPGSVTLLVRGLNQGGSSTR